jgi:putative ABC transport system substrate-binding protein
MIRRREFITLLGGAAAVPSLWPLAVRAQQGRPIRRIAVFSGTAADDPDNLQRTVAFMQAMQELGWTVGRNLRVEYRFGAGDSDRIRKDAPELIALGPEVILAVGGTTVAPLQQASRTIPIVFVNVTDPVSGGFVESLARPGGNATGFLGLEYSMSGKWLDLLKQVAPRVARVAVVRDLTLASGSGQLGAIQAAAPSFGVEVTPVGARDANEIERALSAFVRGGNGGVIVTSSALANFHRNLIVTLASRHRLPAVYSSRAYVAAGGLLSYGVELTDGWRLAAGYVDRILKGEKPADLPVQAPTKYELVINLKTAKALGLTVPPTLLVAADEVIE